MQMERIDKIINHDLFLYHLKQNEAAESSRVFCRHNMAHFLDVARIAYLMNLEEELGIEKEIIYAAALLHDLGRHLQYEKGIPHEVSGASIAGEILADCGFCGEEIKTITGAILCHREESRKECHDLSGVLYRADKLSRTCYACAAVKECNWSDEKKNRGIRF